MKLISQEIYNAQDQFYVTKALSGGEFGLPFDSKENVVKSHWTMLTAATTKDPQAQNSFIQMVYSKATDLSSFTAFPSTYGTIDGKAISGLASPAQGAAFSFLALNLDSKIAGISGNTTTSPTSSNHENNVGAIAGGIVGGLAALALIIIGILFFIRRSRKKVQTHMEESITVARDRDQNPFSQGSLAEPTVHSALLSRTSFGNSDSSSGQPMQITPLRYNENQSMMQQVHTLPRKSGHAQGHTMPVANAAHSNSYTHSNSRSPSLVTSTDTYVLRGELENLRQEMEEMRARTMYEPPPQYT
ncbi:hypothetical protein L218DRAFT_1081560 [Marasmius fiardii PR-910]|nr:hypothetical protein L218DRAFT_1081560 [Marasmius fiardii PR-910]